MSEAARQTTFIEKNALAVGITGHIIAALVSMITVAGAGAFFSIVYPFSWAAIVIGIYTALKARATAPLKSWRFYAASTAALMPIAGLIAAILLLRYDASSSRKPRPSTIVIVIFIILLMLLFAVISKQNDPYFKSKTASAIMPFHAEQAFAEEFKKYTMENNFFSCEIPAGWDLIREREKDAEYKIYEIQLIGPRADRAPTVINVSYYAKDNPDFIDYRDFLNRNSKNILGETRTKRENYGPVLKVELNKRIAYALERELMVYLHPNTKSDESVSIREQLYVVPASEGFYVLHYSASRSIYNNYLQVFERIAQTFRPGR